MELNTAFEVYFKHFNDVKIDHDIVWESDSKIRKISKLVVSL
jgi:hypothetical protein